MNCRQSSAIAFPGLLCLAFVLLFPILSSHAASKPTVDYNRDIRPLLSENCYTCHGPDSEKRKAGLRLDLRDAALSELKSGNHAIVPGDAAKSELVARITTRDDDDRMPPLKTGKTLKPEQIQTLQKWIAEGAQWKIHWSFVPPERVDAPKVSNKRWAKNPIESFHPRAAG